MHLRNPLFLDFFTNSSSSSNNNKMYFYNFSDVRYTFSDVYILHYIIINSSSLSPAIYLYRQRV